MDWKSGLKKIIYFIWESNSIWSWIVTIILSILLVKVVIYPGFGLLFGTTHPVVVVVSNSMKHDDKFDEWWEDSQEWYISNGFNKGGFIDFPFKNGFNKGDIMVVKGEKIEDIRIGEVIVFWSDKIPVTHRVVKKWNESNDYYVATKGDNNPELIKSTLLDETKINRERFIGKIILRIPFLGYLKIWTFDLLKLLD